MRRVLTIVRIIKCDLKDGDYLLLVEGAFDFCYMRYAMAVSHFFKADASSEWKLVPHLFDGFFVLPLGIIERG